MNLKCTNNLSFLFHYLIIVLCKTIDVSKMVAEDWRDLHPTDRQVYEEMARKDKARYQAEKELYKGPWTVPKYRKESNDATAPKRPPSAFIAFSNERRSMVKARMKEATNSGVSKLLSIMWRSAPETIKSRYQVEEKRLREKYMEEIAEWRIKQAEQMKKRQEDAMKIVEGLQSKFEPDTLQSQDTRAYRRVGASQKDTSEWKSITVQPHHHWGSNQTNTYRD